LAVLTHDAPQRVVPPTQFSTHASLIVSQTWPAGHVVAAETHRSAPSSQLSAPLQLTASSHVRGDPPAHMPVAEQCSSVVQNSPSSHGAPTFGENAVVDVDGEHVRHGFAGSGDPAAKQTPPMVQPAQVVTQVSLAGSHSCPELHVLAPRTQRSAASSHVSTPLQLTPSSQKFVVVLPVQVAPEQTSPVVQNEPSSQLAPSLSLHAVAERVVSQT
jgi:hypothetical protein